MADHVLDADPLVGGQNGARRNGLHVGKLGDGELQRRVQVFDFVVLLLMLWLWIVWIISSMVVLVVASWSYTSDVLTLVPFRV